MNIDERIEALTQSLELMASLHQDLEKKVERGPSLHQELEKKWDGRMVVMQQILEDLNDMTKRTTRILEIHEERLDDHDKRLDKLEH